MFDENTKYKNNSSNSVNQRKKLQILIIIFFIMSLVALFGIFYVIYQYKNHENKTDENIVKNIVISNPNNQFDYKPESYNTSFNNEINIFDIRQIISNGDVEKLNNLIKSRKINVNDIIYDDFGYDLLAFSLSVMNPNEEIIKIIIDAGADVNRATKNNGLRPLHIITQRDDIDDPVNIVKLLINSGADVNATDEKGRYPIIQTILKGHIESFKLFVNSNANLNVKNSQGYSLITIAEMQKENTNDEKYNEFISILKNYNKTSQYSDTGLITGTELLPLSEYKYKFIYNLNINGSVKNVEFIIPLPHDIEEYQYISNFNITPKPSIIEKGRYMSTASIKLQDIAKDKNNISYKYLIPYIENNKIKIMYEGNVKTRTYNLKSAKLLNKNISPETIYDLNKYIEPQAKIESNDPYIVNIASEIDGKTQEEILENIYKYIQTNMNYKLTECKGAKQALINGYGKCCDYAAIMAALARAKGIPARIATGKVISRKSTVHNWVEIYYDKYGWVTYDPSVSPINKKIYDLNGNLVRTEKIYDVSPDIKYLKIGSDTFLTYIQKYSSVGANSGNIQVTLDTDAYRVNN